MTELITKMAHLPLIEIKNDAFERTSKIQMLSLDTIYLDLISTIY